MVVGVIAIGQTLIILTAGIDLSCGMVMALGSIVMTKFAADLGVPAPLAILCGIGVTAAVRPDQRPARHAHQAAAVHRHARHASTSPSRSRSCTRSAQTITDLPPLMTWLGNTFTIGGTAVAYGTVLMLAAVPGHVVLLRETAAGRHVYAVGNNPEATRLVGIPTERVLLGVYVLAGVFYGIASLLAVARTGVGDPQRRADREPGRHHRGGARAAPACSAGAA